MPGLLIIAHSPLASALKQAAGHTFSERAEGIETLDIPPNLPLADIEAQTQLLLARVRASDPRQEALILTDVFGATPCNVVQRLADCQQVKVITGCNVPMLWRVMNYLHEPLDMLVTRALAGGTQGVMQIGSSRPQNQNSSTHHDQNSRDHQQ